MVETHSEKRLIGYARVSTVRQTLDSQLEQLRAAGCSRRNIYRERATGARPDRRELNEMLRKPAPGDVVTVTRIDRPTRVTCESNNRRTGYRVALADFPITPLCGTRRADADPPILSRARTARRHLRRGAKFCSMS